MALFAITINNLSPALERQTSELAQIQSFLHAAAQDLRATGGKKTSGNISAPGGGVVGSWTYTPQASS